MDSTHQNAQSSARLLSTHLRTFCRERTSHPAPPPRPTESDGHWCSITAFFWVTDGGLPADECRPPRTALRTDKSRFCLTRESKRYCALWRAIISPRS